MGNYKRKKRPTKKDFMIRRIGCAAVLLILIALIVILIVKLVSGGSSREEGPVLTEAIYDVNPNGGPTADMLLTDSGRKKIADGASIAFSTDSPEIDYRKTGKYELKTVLTDAAGNAVLYTTRLTVRDEQAPTGTAVNQTVTRGQTLTADSFFRDIADNSGADVACYYLQEPDFTRVGTQSVMILLEDVNGNRTQLAAALTVLELADTEAPVIAGAQDRVVYVGDAIAYKKGITVTDNSGAEIPLQIDSSAVRADTPGEYPVIYSAADAAGNKTEVRVIFTVSVKDTEQGYSEELVNRKADEILSGILKDSMSQTDKCKAIYVYIRNNMSYQDSKNDNDWMKAAYEAMTKRTGDCFVYYSLAKLLLTRAGFENQKIYVERENGSHHYWNLVRLESGWYHFDTVPRKAGGDFCLLTDDEILAYSVKHSNSHGFRRSDYPATPTESLGINPWG